MSKSAAIYKENPAKVTAHCRVCGRTDVPLYQKNTCKECLAKEFRELIPAINSVRNLRKAGEK